MQSSNGRILLSPSDLNDYVECGHRTTLARRGCARRARKAARQRRRREAARDKGAASRARLPRACARGRPRRRRDSDGRLGLRCSSGSYSRCDARGADVISQATFVEVDGGDGPTFCSGSRYIKARTVVLRGARREARPRREANVRATALLLQRWHRRYSRRGPEHMHVFLASARQRSLRYDDFAAYYRRVRVAVRSAVASPAGTEPIRSSPARSASFTAFARILACGRQSGTCRRRAPRTSHAVEGVWVCRRSRRSGRRRPERRSRVSRRTPSKRSATRLRYSSCGAPPGSSIGIP